MAAEPTAPDRTAACTASAILAPRVHLVPAVGHQGRGAGIPQHRGGDAAPVNQYGDLSGNRRAARRVR
jgi:hypothetical protein